MRQTSRFVLLSSMAAVLLSLGSGCGFNSDTAKLVCNADLSKVKKIYVVKFEQALADTITQNKLFSEVKQAEPADYLLNVEITNVEEPTMGANVTVHMEAAWELIKAETGKPVLREAISSTFRVTMGEDFLFVVRQRLATEGAARNNIEQGMTKISQLNL